MFALGVSYLSLAMSDRFELLHVERLPLECHAILVRELLGYRADHIDGVSEFQELR